jgi:hypothetical protein
MLEQLRSIDKARLRGFIGYVDDEIMDGINKAIAISTGLEEIRQLGEDHTNDFLKGISND